MNKYSTTSIPEVSVIIPTYNDAEFLKKALSSLMRQTFQNWEAIVVDNNSSDATNTVVNSFSDRRIMINSIENHGIIGASRNLGISKARGKYVAFLDSDDVWFPRKLEIGVRTMNDGYDLFCHAEEWFNEHGMVKTVLYGPKSQTSYKSLLYKGNKLSTSAVMVRRCSLNSVGGFSENPKYITAEDYDLWMRLSEKTSKFIFVSDVLGAYRVHAGGNSRHVKRHRLAEFAVVKRHHLGFIGKNNFLFTLRVLKILLAFSKDFLKKKFFEKLA